MKRFDVASESLDDYEIRWAARNRSCLLMYGILLACFGLLMYLAGVLLAFPRLILGNDPRLLALNEWIVWYSGVPLTLGFALALIDLFWLFGGKRSPRPDVRCDPMSKARVVVALTAYDDEASIGDSVRD